MIFPRCHAWKIAIVISFSLTANSFSDEKMDDKPNRIAELIKQLGHDEYAVRNLASNQLIELGEPNLPALRAGMKSTDLEIRQSLQSIIAKILLNSAKSKSTGIEFRLVDAGKFAMGSPPKEADRRADELLHDVNITYQFMIGIHEITQKQYQQIMECNPSWFAIQGGGQDLIKGHDVSEFPVENISWFDAVEFCNRLSKLDKYEAYYLLADVKHETDSIKSATVKIAGGRGYRLLTEAEWEYACRAGTTKPYSYGNGNTGKDANLRSGTATAYGSAIDVKSLNRTTKVGSFPANPWGVFDMHGNVAEWCWDWYDKDYYATAPNKDPAGPDRGVQRVLRGGSWLLSESSCRSASRAGQTPDERKQYLGFRIARTPPQ